jgi:hypothetical protein
MSFKTDHPNTPTPFPYSPFGLLLDKPMQVMNSTAMAIVSKMPDPFGVRARWMREQILLELGPWLDRDAATHTKDDGTSVGGRYYTHLKNKMQKVMESYPDAIQHGTKQVLMHDPSMQEMLRGEHMVEYFRMIDAIMRERYPNDQGILFRPEYNHHFLTEESHASGGHGKIVAMPVDEIVKLFARPKQAKKGEMDDFPHIIVTSSHAQGETLKDVTNITHGIEALARDSEGKPLPHGYRDKGIASGQTLTIYACDVEKSPMLNAAQLLSRILELKKVVKTGKPEKEFNDISPGAKRIAKLILKCMAENPAMVDVDDPRPMRDIAVHATAPIALRADAVHIAHHFQLIGYSKGGNVVSDAMRYLVSELTAKNAKGRDVFIKHEQSPTRQQGERTMSPDNVRNLVRGIAVMAIASVEVGMSDYYKQHGVRRVAFNNHHDLISAHHNYEGSRDDERWMIEGVEREGGHAPADMMGARADIKGYAHDDPRVARRLKEAFAPNYGKAAIARVLFGEGAAKGHITIDPAAGTTDQKIEAYEGEIARAFEIVGLIGATLHRHPNNGGRFTIDVPNANFATDEKALTKLQKAFSYMRENTKGLVISQAILDEDIAEQLRFTQNQETPTTRVSKVTRAIGKAIGRNKSGDDKATAIGG